MEMFHDQSPHEYRAMSMPRAEFPKRELKGVADPEQKRKIIGRVFVEVFQRESAKRIKTPSGSRKARFTRT